MMYIQILIFLSGAGLLPIGSARAACTCGISPSGDTSGAADVVALRACIDGFGSTG